MIQAGPKTELCELAEKWGTDKWFYYTEFYHFLLRNHRNAKKVLELGIGSPSTMLDSLSRKGVTEYMTGASLFMWSEYFREAQIYGLDIDHDTLISGIRIKSLWCDQSDPMTYPLEVLGSEFDLIVEDGSHKKEHQLTAIETLVPQLAKGGIYIAEDCGYMTREERAHFADSIAYPCEIHEFHNPELGDHIASVIVIRR